MAKTIPFVSYSISQIGKVTDNPFQTITRDEESIIQNYLANIILYKLPIRDCERDNFIQFCRLNCKENEILDQINEFELRYRPDEAIKWYTHPSGFPSKFINMICRTQNSFLISKIRYYLKHLHEQLTQLYINSLVWIPNFITVYRGQKFSSKTFKKLVQSNGKIILTTAFLSTTSTDDVAVIFSGYNIHSNKSLNNEISVIFKILIQTKTTRLKPFAYIQEYSHIKDEKEILLSIGMIFSCVNIYKRSVNFYEILLIHGENEEKIEKDILHKAFESYNNRITMTMGAFLISMNIHIKPEDDFYYQSFDSFFEEIVQFRSQNVFNSAPIDFSLATISNPILSVTHDHLIIWLDFHIGLDGVCEDLKDKLANAINITLDVPLMRHEIDRLISNNEIYPHMRNQLIAVQTIEECLSLISTHYHKKIFLITSGSLGQVLIPKVLTNYPYVDKFFVFCADISSHVDWAIDYTDHILMFDFHHDLLARVVHSIGMYYMEEGIFFDSTNEHKRSLYCFYIAKKLVMRANHIFNPYICYSLTRIEESITNQERYLPNDEVQNILNNLSYG